MKLKKSSYKNLQCSEIETSITQRVGVVVYLSYSVITLDMYEEHAWNKTVHFYILYTLQIQQDLSA